MVEHIRRQQQAGNLQPERAGCILQFGRLLERIAFRIPRNKQGGFGLPRIYIGGNGDAATAGDEELGRILRSCVFCPSNRVGYVVVIAYGGRGQGRDYQRVLNRCTQCEQRPKRRAIDCCMDRVALVGIPYPVAS